MNKTNKKESVMKTSSSSTYALIIVAIFLLVLAIFYFTNNGNKIYDSNQTLLNVTPQLRYLQDCYESRDTALSDKNEYQKSCPNIVKESDIQKLQILDNVVGQEVCNSFGIEDKGEAYQACVLYVRGCYIKYELAEKLYNSDSGNIYRVYECQNGDYLYMYYRSLPPSVRVVKIELSEKDSAIIKSK